MRRHNSGGLSWTGRLFLPFLILLVSGLANDALANSRARSAAVRRAMSRPMDRRESGVLVPRTPSFERQQRKLERFFGYRNAAKRYLKASGARPAPAFHQQFVARALGRAERVLNRSGLSATPFEVLVLEEGAADGLNAASWAGQLLTINRDIIDMSFHIASAVSAAGGSQVEAEKNLYRLAMWERGNAEMPRFKVQNKARRNDMAEGIFMGVLLHEIGHAFRHSPAVIERDPPLWVPGQEGGGESGAASRRQEREADAISLELGMAGASPDPAAFTLFFKYMTISRAISGPRKSLVLGDTQTHPSDVERIRNANRALKRGGLSNPYEPNPGKIWIPTKNDRLILPADARR